MSDAGQHLNSYTENCLICGTPLDYESQGSITECNQCGKREIANISCPNGHYICDECHGKDAFDMIRDELFKTELQDPFAIAENLMARTEQVPMLGCENAWIAAGAFMAALKNKKTIPITDDQILEALYRTKKQAIGGYCGLTGVCGIVPAIGACFSVIFKASCSKDIETAQTMKIAANIVRVIADETGPCCCKNFVRKALGEAIRAAEALLGVVFDRKEPVILCSDAKRHPHGCRREKCTYFASK